VNTLPLLPLAPVAALYLISIILPTEGFLPNTPSPKVILNLSSLAGSKK